jgi:3-phenylpropionate/cinnamic acid dioxygenase small subunit
MWRRTSSCPAIIGREFWIGRNMALTIEDRIAIHELVSLHGHLMDNGDFHRLDEVFTSDIVYDVVDFGFGELHGLEAIKQASVALGDGNPLGHHVTNIVIAEVEGDVVRVLSKGIGVRTDGSSGSVCYDDSVRRVADGWRIARRKVIARRKPLQR